MNPSTIPPSSLALVTREGLRQQFGIHLSTDQLRRLMKAGRFPKAVRFSAGGPLHWRGADIERYLEQLAAAVSAAE